MKVLIIDRFPSVFLGQLAELPVEVSYLPETQRPEVLELIPAYEVLIMNSKVRADQELADRATKLRMVLRAGVGLDHIDVDYLASKGIRVHNTAGANADSVGEQTVGMLLAINHKLIKANQQVKKFIWSREENRAEELTRKTVGIIGYGNTGKAVAKRLMGFGCKLLVYDKYVSDFHHDYIEEVDIETIHQEADIVTFHVPLTDETREWVNTSFIKGMQKPFTLLNLARGPVVHIPSLIQGLQSGKVRAAALDVLPNEKLHTLSPEQRQSYETLFAMDNVMLAPHVGGWSVESLQNINNRLLEYVKEIL